VYSTFFENDKIIPVNLGVFDYKRKGKEKRKREKERSELMR